MNESAIERFLVNGVRKMGGYALKLAPTYSGLPDRLVILPDGVARFIELKADGGKPRAQQLLWQKRLRSLGFESEIINSKESAIRFLEDRENG